MGVTSCITRLTALAPFDPLPAPLAKYSPTEAKSTSLETRKLTLYFAVDALTPALARVEQFGGHAGQAAQDMGTYYTAMCTDDHGTQFGLMAPVLD
jgi:hypothetical protein